LENKKEAHVVCKKIVAGVKNSESQERF